MSTRQPINKFNALTLKGYVVPKFKSLKFFNFANSVGMVPVSRLLSTI